MAAKERRDWYETPLYYDIIFDEDTSLEATFLETLHDRHGNGTSNSRTVLELACGGGRLLAELAHRHWKVAGFDISRPMLDFARDRLARRNLPALVWEDRMETFSVPRQRRFDLVHCLVSTFKYLLTEKDALACLSRVSAVLKPGGLFVLGIHLTDYFREKPSHERWVVQRDGIKIICNTRTWPPVQRIEPMRTRLQITAGGGKTRLQETRWDVRSYSAPQLRRLLRKVKDLSLVACHDFRHDAEEHRSFDDEYSDLVLVLKKR